MIFVFKVDKVQKKLLLLECVRLLTEGVVDGKTDESFISETNQKTSSTKEKTYLKMMKKLQKIDKMSDDISIADSDYPEVPRLDGFSWKEYSSLLQEARVAMRDRIGWDQFSKVFMISALLNDGTQAIMVRSVKKIL